MFRGIGLKHFIFLFFMCFTSLCFSQKKIAVDFSKACSFNGQITSKEVYAFNPSDDAQAIISKIVSEMGLKVNFVIIAVSIDNAYAVLDQGVRYIYYSESFMQKINIEANTNWSSVFILAHEIGHHLNGHTLDTLGNTGLRIQYELEADEFAGFILARFGSSISEAQSAIQTAVSNDSQTSLYPPKRARLEATAVGWKKGSVKPKQGTDIPVQPNGIDNAKDALASKECEKNNTGDYSFTNSTQKRVKVFLYLEAEDGFGSGPMIESPTTGGYIQVKWLAGDITIEPGQTEYFYNVKAITLVYDIREISIDRFGQPNGFRRKGNIMVEKCKLKPFVIK